MDTVPVVMVSGLVVIALAFWVAELAGERGNHAGRGSSPGCCCRA